MLVDFHSHIYKNFNITDCLQSALAVEGLAKKVAFLTERSDCNFFDNLKTILGAIDGLHISFDTNNLLEINSTLSIFSGRQYASSEGIEVLSLFNNLKIKDGLPAEHYCQAIIEQNGIIAFSWAFGKWLGMRGQKIQDLCKKFGSAHIIILDSGLRPECIGLPSRFQELKKDGFKFLAGSDPLPLRSHQRRVLSYGAILENPPKNITLEEHLRNQIKEKNDFAFAGSRSSIIEFAKDQLLLRL